MNRNNFKIARILIKMAIGMLTTLAVTSCVTVPQPLGPQLSPAPLPTYSKGTTFVYSDGRWDTVTAVSPGVVTWSDYRGLVSSGLPDFTYRPSKWKSKTRSVTRQFGPRSDLFTQSATTLWPLRTGNVANYSETGTWIEKDGTESSYRTNWSCAVEGTERVSVMAGDFDTFKIVCKRYYVSRSKNTSSIKEAKTWNYAPEVGHYVLATTKYYYDRNPRSCGPFCRPSTAFQQERAVKWSAVFSKLWSARKAANPSTGRVINYGLRWKPCPPKPSKHRTEATAVATFRS